MMWRQVAPGEVTHESHGARQTLPGFNYQIKLCMLLLQRARSTGLTFTAAVEYDKAPKFDDIFLSTPSLQQFYQVKSSVERKPVTFLDLFPKPSEKGKKPSEKGKKPSEKGKKPLDLKMYFQSFKDTLKNLNIDNNYSAVENQFIIYTNRDLQFSDEKLGDFIFSSDVFDTVSEDLIMKCDLLRFKTDFIGKEDVIRTLTGENFVTPESRELAEKFLREFYFAVNQYQEEKIEELIKSELEQEFGSVHHKNIYNTFFADLHDWFSIDGKKGTFKNQYDIKKYFENIKKIFFGNTFFDIFDPNDNFYGRESELAEILKILKAPKKKLVDVVVSGLGGVGKTELLRMFGQRNRAYFQNVVWINAETQQSMQESFVRLGRKLKIMEDPQNTDDLVAYIYDFFKDKKCLFIFDNIEKFSFAGNTKQFFLPKVKDEALRIIFTSQLSENLQCTFEIPLNIFSKTESVAFLNSELGPGESVKDLETIADTVGNLPLALQLLTAYIKGRKKGAKILGKTYTVKSFLDEYERSAEKLLKYEFDVNSMDKYRKPLFTTWELTINNISMKRSGQLALEVLNTMAYLNPDRIPTDFFQKFSTDDLELADAIILLKTYSLIKEENRIVSIHRLVQDVIRQASSNSKKEINILEKALQIFSSSIEKGNESKININRARKIFWMFNGHANSIWSHSSKYEDLIQRHCVVGEALVFDLRHDYDRRAINDLLVAADLIIKPMKQFLEPKNVHLMYAEIEKANLYSLLNKYEESELQFDNILTFIGNESKSAVYWYALASKANNLLRNYEMNLNLLKLKIRKNLRKPKKDLYYKALDFSTKISKNICYLTSRNDFCNLLMTLEIARNLRKHLINRYFESARRRQGAFDIYSHILSTKSAQNFPTAVFEAAIFVAQCHEESKRYRDAERVLQNVLNVDNINKEGDSFTETLTLIKNMSNVLFLQNKKEDAINLFENVLNQAQNVEPNNNMNIIDIMNEMSIVINKQKCYDYLIGHLRKFNKYIITKFSENLFLEQNDINKVKRLYAEKCNYLLELIRTSELSDPVLELVNELLLQSTTKLGDEHSCSTEILSVKLKILVKTSRFDDAFVAITQLITIYLGIKQDILSSTGMRRLSGLAVQVGLNCSLEHSVTLFSDLSKLVDKYFGNKYNLMYHQIPLEIMIYHAKVLVFHKQIELAIKKLKEVSDREMYITNKLMVSEDQLIKITGENCKYWKKYPFGEGALLLSKIMPSEAVGMLTEFNQGLHALEKSLGRKIIVATVSIKIRERIVELLCSEGEYAKALVILAQLISENKKFTLNYHKYNGKYFLCKAKQLEDQNNMEEALLDYDKAFESIRERYQIFEITKKCVERAIESNYANTKLLDYFNKKVKYYEIKCKNITGIELNPCNLWHFIIYSFFVADVLMRMARFKDATHCCELLLSKISNHKNERNDEFHDVLLRNMCDIYEFTVRLLNLIKLNKFKFNKSIQDVNY